MFFSSLPLADDPSTTKYDGAAAVNGSIYMAPMDATEVGAFDTSTGSFRSTPVGDIGRFSARRFSGAAAVGPLVYLAPHHADGIGILDSATLLFRTITINNEAMFKYQGVAFSPASRQLYFGPHDQHNVLVRT